MNHFGLPLADGGWVGPLIVIIFVIISALSQLAGKWKEAQKEAARRARANQPERIPTPRDPLEDEIAEFLKRAAQRQRPVQADRPAPPRPPSPTPASEAMRPFRPPPPKPVLEPVEAELVLAEDAQQESVAEHVRDRFDRPQFGQVGSAGLGKEAAQADEKAGERLREKFGHQVSRLAGVSGEAAVMPVAVEPTVPADRIAAPPAVSAAGMAALLTNPGTLRQAILVSEILHRPEERWRR
jgi:hypothetical protein